MVTTEKLYKLISTLQSAEKRYFKLLAARQEAPSQQYMHLFQLMETSIARDAHDEPVFTLDEETLIIRLKRKGVPENQFHVVRYQLAQMLFKALRLMQEENNREDVIKVLLKNAKLMERRGMFEWAEEMAEEALNESVRFEYHALAVEAHHTLIYVRNQRDARGYAEKLRKNLEDVETTALLYADENKLFSLSYKALALNRTGKGTSMNTHNREAEQIADALRSFDPDRESTFLSSVYYFSSQAALADLQGSYQDARPWLAKILELWESERYRHMQNERPRQFIVHVSNYLNFSITMGDFDAYDRHFKTLENFKPSNSDDEAEVFQNIVFLQQLYYLNKGMPEEARKLIPSIEKGLKKYAFKINKSRLFSIRYHIILTYFVLAEYDKALLNCETLQKYGKSEQRRDLQLFANILRNIAHLELQEYEALQRFVRVVKSNLDQALVSPDFERIALTHLGRLAELYLKHPTENRLWQKILKPVLEEFLQALDHFAASGPPQLPMGFEETTLWVKSKLTGASMKDIIRGK